MVNFQVPICNECVASSHMPPDHQYERITDVEEQQASEINTLVVESQNKIKTCEEASEGLEGLLSDLQMQRDNAKGLIEETFQTYRAMLVKQQVH